MKKLLSSALAAVLFVSMLTICAFSADISKTVILPVGERIEIDLNLAGVSDPRKIEIQNIEGDETIISKTVPQNGKQTIEGVKAGTWKIRVLSQVTGQVMSEYTIIVVIAEKETETTIEKEFAVNFGGSDFGKFYSVIATNDGYVAVGYSHSDSFGNGDWSGVSGKGNIDAIIVKYDKSGNVIWKKNFGGSGWDEFSSVTATEDGYVAVGRSDGDGFGTGDWKKVSAKGSSVNAIIVKYDKNGNVVWKKNFGGSYFDEFESVTTTEDGYVAVGGSSNENTFGTNDWKGVSGKGGCDAIIVKYDKNGNVIWRKNFGGSDYDEFNSVTATEDGYVAVGYSEEDSFGNGDWKGVSGKGRDDAIIIKYDKIGNVIWKKNFGGSSWDVFNSVTASQDGYVAVGNSYSGSFGNGDWNGVSGKGSYDAIIVKYDKSGNVIWKKNFGGSDWDEFYSVTATEDGYVAVGESENGSFGNGDWNGVSAKGGEDAILVKYTTSTSTPIAPTIFSNTATLPSFKVKMNNVTIDNTYLKYPFIVCNDITYFPMTYNDSRFLGVATNYTESTGLVISRLGSSSGKYIGEKDSVKNSGTFDVTLATGKITVNGKSVNNYAEEYPLLLFRNVTYFPMTWRFCVDEFGWDYKFDNANGLVIKTN